MTVLDPARKVHAFLDSVREEMKGIVHPCTVPIIGQQYGTHGKSVVGGTGVLFAVDDARFLISAAHVLRLKPDHGCALCVPSGDGLSSDLSGELVTDFNHESVDVGVLRLSAQSVAGLVNTRADFLRSGQTRDVSPNDLPHGGYVAYGYPDEAAQLAHDGAIAPVPAFIGCTPPESRPNDIENYDTKTHALLSFRREEMVDIGTGAKMTAPHPSGMSGCGIWWVYAGEDLRKGWRREFGRLVGVQCRYYPDPGLLKFIPFTLVKGMIRAAWPELGPALAVDGPQR